MLETGKLIEETFQVETFFENMVQFSSYLESEYPEYNLKVEAGSFNDRTGLSAVHRNRFRNSSAAVR